MTLTTTEYKHIQLNEKMFRLLQKVDKMRQEAG